ncbi:MAG: hypothetical protein JJE39_07760 [Vicinamibacteria bacterium]|nr:hypothetical protein [Vicinamibacteria bacterium]
MNPLKALLNKVLGSPPHPGAENASKQEVPFEWNPDQETVAPTSSGAASWKRRDTQDQAPEHVHGDATHAEIAKSAHSLPTPVFEKPTPSTLATPAARPLWKEASASAAPSAEVVPSVSVKPAVNAEPPASAPVPPVTTSENWVKPSVPDQPAAIVPLSAQSLIPPSDFEDVYRKAGIKSPVHGYGVERVYRLLTSRRLVGLDRSVRRSALLTALDAAAVPASDVSQDVVLRRKALTAHEAEKALELQSLRSRNESRAEALQDTVETFTRQKQSQIERLAQGSTSAVRAQSDLEIRKRMEQDRLYRSLAYFVEPLPSGTAAVRPALQEAAQTIKRFDATIEMATPLGESSASASPAEASVSESPRPPADPSAAPPKPPSPGADTRPLSQSGLEAALKAAAEDARQAARGQTAVAEDGAGDKVDALRKLREPPTTESKS